MKVGKNRAWRIKMGAGTSEAVPENYVSFLIGMGEAVGTRTNILPDSIDGIDENASDHGIILHWEHTGLDGTTDGYLRKGYNLETNKLDYDGELLPHSMHRVNITFQEIDYKEDGTVAKKRGTPLHSAYNLNAGTQITLIWTKDVSWTNTNPEKYVQVKREANGKPILENGKRVMEPIPSYSHKAGEVQLWQTYGYNEKGETLTGGGEIDLPRDFCGYIILPFSAFHRCWDSSNSDGKINLKNLELANMYIYLYPSDEGQIYIDEYCLWGPTFANVDGAYDYGNITFENHRDSLINRKLITIKNEETSTKKEEKSVEPPKVIETAVTLENKDTGIKLEAPTSAKIDAKTVLTVGHTDMNEYNTKVFGELFGTDTTAYSEYMIYLGEDGDQEPQDFVQIDLPLPEGFTADNTEVYMVAADEKTLCAYEFSEDGKMVKIKTDALGCFVLAKKGSAPAGDDVSEEASGNATEDTSKDSSKATDEKTEGSNLAWLWIIIGAVVVIGAGVVVIFIAKVKKKEEPESEETTEE